MNALAPTFLAGGGQMGARIRNHDWWSSPLGPPEAWPLPLQTIVGVVLSASHPMFVTWGPDHRVLFNDGYAAILGRKAASALGEPLLVVWPEIVADLRPLLSQVEAGQPVHMDDIALSVDRNGIVEEAHFAFSYTPVRDERGKVCGLFCATLETTATVFAARRTTEDRERQRRMLQQMPGMVAMLVGPEHRFDYVNDAYVAFAGPRAYKGRTVREVFPDLDGQGFYELLDQVYADGQPFAARMIPLRLEGDAQDRLIDLLYHPVTDDDGKVIGIFVGGYDVTEQVRGVARFRAVQETSVDGFMLLDSLRDEDGRIVDFRWTYVNEAAAGIVGRSRHSLLNQCLLELMPGNLTDGLFDAYVRVVETGVPWTSEITYRHGGMDVYIRLTAARLDDGFAVSFTDLSARRRSEERLRESEDHLRDAIERLEMALDAGAILGTWVWNVREDQVSADERFARSFGLDPELCRRGMPIEMFTHSIHEDDRDRVEATIAEALNVGGSYRSEYRVRRHDGLYHWVEAAGRVEMGTGGHPVRFPGILLDIDERRAAEAERDRAMALLSSFTAAVPGVVYAKDRDGRLLVGNRGTTELIGKPPEEYLGKTDAEVLDDKDQATIVMANDRRIMESGSSEQVEEDVYLPDGTPVVWLSTKAPLRNEADDIIGLIGASVDITHRKQAEAALERSKRELQQLNDTLESRIAAALAEQERVQEALRQSQKLESMGQLTGGVAHDFNNLLTPIVGSLDLLHRRRVGSEREQRLINGALQSADRAKTLVQRLLAFARRQPLQAKSVDLAALIEGMADLVASTSGPRVKITVDVASDLSPVQADANQLEMAILNLAVNARDAMPEGGHLTIAAQPTTIPAERMPNLPAGPYVRLSVSDTGVGMDEATLKRAIEPFFSTKGIGKGTGLGLSMVHGLAAQLGGELVITSNPGDGTTIDFWLPVAPVLVPLPDSATLAPGAPVKGTALLVDDEDIVRESTTDMLMELGFTVVPARSAEEALAMMDSGLSPDVVLTDHLMPGMSGIDLARVIRQRSSCAVLLVSGYADDEGVSADLPRLTKPFRQSELASALDNLLTSNNATNS
jgi:PAS domain S-box-containing protein